MPESRPRDRRDDIHFDYGHLIPWRCTQVFSALSASSAVNLLFRFSSPLSQQVQAVPTLHLLEFVPRVHIHRVFDSGDVLPFR